MLKLPNIMACVTATLTAKIHLENLIYIVLFRAQLFCRSCGKRRRWPS